MCDTVGLPQCDSPTRLKKKKELRVSPREKRQRFYSAALKLNTGLMIFSTLTVSCMLARISSFGL